jgi:hypothetical protein
MSGYWDPWIPKIQIQLDPKKKLMDLDTGSGCQKKIYGSGYRIWIPKIFSWIWIHSGYWYPLIPGKSHQKCLLRNKSRRDRFKKTFLPNIIVGKKVSAKPHNIIALYIVFLIFIYNYFMFENPTPSPTSHPTSQPTNSPTTGKII